MFEQKNTSKLSLEEKIQLLMDERDIKNVMDRYSRASSRADLELFRSCYHDDAIMYNGPNGDGKVSDFLEKFNDIAGGLAEVGQYYQANPLIEIDGDVAHTEVQCFSPKILFPHSYNGNRVMRFGGARYLRRFERRNGEWRISASWFLYEWCFYQDVPPQNVSIGSYAAPDAQVLKPYSSQRNKDDLSYRFSTL